MHIKTSIKSLSALIWKETDIEGRPSMRDNMQDEVMMRRGYAINLECI